MLAAVIEAGGYRPAAKLLGCNESAVRRIMNQLHATAIAPRPHPDPIPDEDIETREIIDLMKRRFTKRQENDQAKRWRRFTVPTEGPYGLMLFGDPHVDDDGCDWPLLDRHIEIAKTTPHVYAVSVGDVHNNWTGRLARLYAEQETSSKTAAKLVRWLLAESGVPWFLWVHGNHDAWQGGIPLIEGMNANEIVMEDWQAKVTLVSGDHELRLWVAHNFKGTSQWNKLHGPQKAALLGERADIYVAGHHHNWALHHEEHDHEGWSYWLARCRGYKRLDSYASHHGFGEQAHGSSILAVVDPKASGPTAVQCFADPIEGAEYLTWKRERYERAR